MNSENLLDAVGDIREVFILEAKRPARVRRPVLRMLLAAALAVALMSASVCAMTAADVGAAYDVLYRISPAVAQRLKPVQKSCTDQGIQVEVISADVRGDTAEICVGIKDLEGDRVDGTLDLFDSYSIRTAHDSAMGCEFLRYDPENGTAEFFITIRHLDGAPIRKDKVTFHIQKMLMNKGKWTGDLPLTIDPDPATIPDGQFAPRGISVIYDPDHPDEPAKEVRSVHLAPGDDPVEPVPGVQLTAAGTVDGRLHVQIHYDDILHTDNHGWIWLEDPEGTRIEPGFNSSFWDEAGTGSYEEYEFDRPDAKGCRLLGEFTTCDTLIEGNWEITFPVQ